MLKPNTNTSFALFTLRVFLGLVFLMQGYGKIFSWGIDGVYQNAFASYESMLPVFLLKITAYFTSYAELIGGLLLCLGIFKKYSLYALGLVLLIVTFGHGLSQAIWDMQQVFFRLIPLVALLLLPEELDKFQLEKIWKK